MPSGVRRWCLLSGLAAIGLLVVAQIVAANSVPGLPRIGAAPAFSLTDQAGERLSLTDLRGKVVVVTFIFVSCADSCPLLTAKMVALQSRLGDDLGPRAYFVSVTVDPEHDTPEVLRQHAEAHGARLSGWSFLTGAPNEIRDVARRYGVVFRKTPHGDVDHTFLTSLIDRGGTLRVQYLGTRFEPEDMLADIRALLREGQSQ